MRSFTPIILIAISIGLFFLFIMPRYHDVQDLQAKQVEYKNALTEASALGETRDDLLTRYNSFSQDNLNRIARLIPDTVNTVKLMTDIDSIAGRYGTTLRNITVNQAVDTSQVVGQATTAPAKPYQTTSISFHFVTTYPNLISFLRDLEKSLELVDVKSISFNVATDIGPSAGLYEYQITLNTYSLR